MEFLINNSNNNNNLTKEEENIKKKNKTISHNKIIIPITNNEPILKKTKDIIICNLD
jgi:hypothetical protein